MYVNLKLQIWRTGVRQSRLAQELGIDETVLSRIINCYRKPSPGVRRMLAKYFQVDERWLFQREEVSTGVQGDGSRGGKYKRLTSRGPEFEKISTQ